MFSKGTKRLCFFFGKGNKRLCFFQRNAWKILTLSIYRFLAISQWFILKSNDYNYTFFKLPLREPATSWSLPRSQHLQLPRWEIFLSYFTFSFKIVLLQGMDLIMRRTSDVRRVIKIKKGQFKDCSRRRCLRGIITRNLTSSPPAAMKSAVTLGVLCFYIQSKWKYLWNKMK